jgi:hypothetical protein
MGVSVGLTASAISPRAPSRRRSAGSRELLTLEKVGAWAITEPNSGSDAFGSMLSTARRDGDEYVLNGNEDVHHERPLRRHDRVHLQARRGQRSEGPQGVELRARPWHARPRAVQAASQDGHALVAHRRAVPRRRARRPRPPGRRDRGPARAAATARRPRSSRSAPAWPPWRSASSRSASICVEYAKNRVQFGIPSASSSSSRRSSPDGGRPDERAEPRVPHDRAVQAGRTMTFAEASAMKLYSAQAATEVALEAVQLHGGNGYMSEFRSNSSPATPRCCRSTPAPTRSRPSPSRGAVRRTHRR